MSISYRLGRLLDVLVPFIAVAAALAVGAIILLLQDTNPLTAYQAMLTGAFTNKNGLADTMVKMIPLLLVALGVAIAFRGGVINIGAEGQLIVGAVLTTYVGLQLGDTLPGWLVIIIGLAAGALMGGFWAAIPGYLKARLGVNEILSTIMMNQIAIQIAFALLRGPMIDPAEVEAGTNIPHSARLPQSTDLPRFTDMAKWIGLDKSADELGLTGFAAEIYGLLVEPTRLHFGLIIAVIMAILVYIFLWRTTIGYRIRAVGQNPAASRYAGISVQRYIVLSMTLGGMFAGLAGAVEILGLHHRMFEPQAVSAGYGFSGIVVALFGSLHPLGIIPSALLFGGLLVGGDKMQRAIQVPQVLITVILGMVVLFVVSADLWVRRRQDRRVSVDDDTPPAEATPEVAS
ncbi:MAG TPA: ABC transporter permease [Anaerolineae bacterium]|jgi:simple sugar transport system permease protein|nr:ABC transporter permease [Anaerolineae bacterium]